MKKRIRCPENLQDARYIISLIEHVQQHSPLCLVAHWCLSCWCLRLCLRTVDHSVKTPQSIWQKVSSSWTTHVDVASTKGFSPIAESWKSSLCGRGSGFSCLRETTARVFKRYLNLVALSPCPLENTKYSNPKSRLKLLAMIHNVTVQSHLLDIFQAQTKAPTKIKCHSLMPRQQRESPEVSLPLPFGGNKYIPKR